MKVLLIVIGWFNNSLIDNLCSGRILFLGIHYWKFTSNILYGSSRSSSGTSSIRLEHRYTIHWVHKWLTKNGLCVRLKKLFFSDPTISAPVHLLFTSFSSNYLHILGLSHTNLLMIISFCSLLCKLTDFFLLHVIS